jgi:hypothetical protein
MSVDFASLMAQAGPMEAIPVGDYDVVVKDAQAAESKNTGKPMVKCRFAIESGPHANRTLWWNAVISQESPEALAIFFRQMDALGLGSQFFAASPSIEQVAQNLVGKRARINVAHRQYNGATQPDIKRVSAPLGGNGGLGGPVAATPSAPSPAVTPAPPAPPAPQPSAPQPSAPAPQSPAPTSGVDIGEGTQEQPAGLPPKTPF